MWCDEDAGFSGASVMIASRYRLLLLEKYRLYHSEYSEGALRGVNNSLCQFWSSEKQKGSYDDKLAVTIINWQLQ